MAGCGRFRERRSSRRHPSPVLLSCLSGPTRWKLDRVQRRGSIASTPILTLKNVSKEYPDSPQPLRVLTGIDSRTGAPGESAAIVGPSGCGKRRSSISSYNPGPPHVGNDYVCGPRSDAPSEAELANLRNAEIGFVFQLHHLRRNAITITFVPHPCKQERAQASNARSAERVGLPPRAPASGNSPAANANARRRARSSTSPASCWPMVSTGRRLTSGMAREQLAQLF